MTHSPPLQDNCKPEIRPGVGCYGAGAFSLIELLSVVAIISLVAAFLVPSIGGIKSSQSFTKSLFDLAGILDVARNEAQAKNSYVWVGLAEKPGIPGGLLAATVVSLSGEAIITSDVEQSGRVYELSGMAFGAPVPGSPAGNHPIQDSDLGSFTQKAGGVPTQFSYLIRFSSNGEAVVKANSVPNWVQIPLREAKPGSVNSAILDVSGLSGLVKIVREP